MTELPEGLARLGDKVDYPTWKIRVVASRHLWQDSVNLYGRVYGYAGNKPLDIVDLVVAEVADAHTASVDPFTTIGKDDAQELMDTLWNVGIRPSEQTRLHTDDGRKHLEDMRKIAFAGLKKLELDL